MIDLSVLKGFGFRTTFALAFEQVLPALPHQPPVLVPLPGRLPLDRRFFEAAVKVELNSADSANSFEVTVYGMELATYRLLQPDKTVVRISLGYAESGTQEVMRGILTEKSVKAGDCWYEATLKGVDFVFERLRCSADWITADYRRRTVRSIAEEVCRQAGVTANITADGPVLDAISFPAISPLEALRRLADRAGFALQAKDGRLWLGPAATLGARAPVELPDGADSTPVSVGNACPDDPVEARDFNTPGVPALRPTDPVTLGKDTFRIESVTHELTREGGYSCRGRAVPVDTSDGAEQSCRRPSATRVAERLRGNAETRERQRPAVEVGEVHLYHADQHTADLQVGLQSCDRANPSVRAALSDHPTELPEKPIVSPFAFDRTGLVVPVYEGMRAVLEHPYQQPDDALVNGFVWTDDMQPPQSQAGDWRLCLPTQLQNNRPAGKGVDDLITADGQRVIQVKGLKINIGAGLLSDVGQRPQPGSDESVTIQTAQGARITLKDSRIELSDGQVTITVADGKVSIG